MADILINMEDQLGYSKDNPSVVNHFIYGATVAQSQIYIRMGFIRKVYGILAMQLILTTLVASVALFTPIMRFYINENGWLVTVAFLLSVILLLSLMIKRKETPLNYILLTAFTTVEAYTIAVVVAFYDQLAVLQAFILTTCVVIALTVYTFQSKRDFSSWGAGLFTCLWILLVAGFLQMFLGSTQMELFLSVGGALVFSLFIVYDTHMIMHRLSPEEYIIAAIDLYLDIINLFLYVLRIVGQSRKH